MVLRIGMMTPSSNTVLEPLTSRLVAAIPGASVHFARFRVTAIGLDAETLGQFDDRPMLEAAELLADAKVDVISWNGTSAGWLGLDADRRLCARITAATGIPASTSVLGLFEAMRRRGDRRLGLVTPYTPDVQAAIVANFAREGIDIVAERHLGIRDNFSFAEVDAATIGGMIDAVALERPDAISILCTNLAGLGLVAEFEARHGIAIHDSIATAVAGALRTIGRPTASLAEFGQVFVE